MSNNNILKAGLKSMGIDVDKLPKDKIEPILQLADSISDPEKMTPQQIQKLQNLLGVTQTATGVQSWETSSSSEKQNWSKSKVSVW